MIVYPSIDASSCFAPFPPDIQRTLLHLNSPRISFVPHLPNGLSTKIPSLPYQDLPQGASTLAINELLRIRKLDIHVRVDAYQATVIFGLPPFEADYDWLIDPSIEQKR